MRAIMLCSGVLAIASLAGAQVPATGRGGGSAPAASSQAVPPGNAANGKKIFSSDGCYECHGYEGQGGSAGARLAPRPIAFTAFVNYVRRPTNQMPPYTAKVVSDQELADIYAFLLSIPSPAAAKSIPQLSNP
jgi:mono/diheme cytochrome c family protein